MIRLKVSINEDKKPNQVVMILNDIINDIIQSDKHPLKITVATDGNSLGYGYILIDNYSRIEHLKDEDIKIYVNVSLEIIAQLVKYDNVRDVMLLLQDNKETNYLLYDTNIARGRIIEDYIIINKKR